MDLINVLNPILRGWAQHHCPVVAKQTLSKLDALIYWRLMRWAKRRHPRKSRKWCFDQYWKHFEDRQQFAAAENSENGSTRMRRLYRLSDMPIRRHQKIRGEFNPFDPQREEYGEELRTKRLLSQIAYRTELTSLFKSQSGNCALCGTAITRETGWHDHHIVWKTNGGSDPLTNRVLLHPTCHTKVHALGASVVKPALSRA